MNVIETFPYGVQMFTYDAKPGMDPRAVHYEVRVDGRLAWTRMAVPGAHPQARVELATAQRRYALHLIAIEEKAERDKKNESVAH
jgi:hypothetical protein